MLRLLVTGGTFDKEYDEIGGTLFFKDTHVDEMLGLGRCRVPVAIETVMLLDSLQMTDADRAAIADRCRACDETRIVITHGTDTMVETAAVLALAVPGQDHRPHRRDGAVRLRQLGRPVQPGQRHLVCAGAAGRRVGGDERLALRLGQRDEEPGGGDV